MTTFREKYWKENIEQALYPGRLTTEDFNKLMDNQERLFKEGLAAENTAWRKIHSIIEKEKQAKKV